MKKWEKPELKVLGVENTLEDISVTNIYAGDDYMWVCKNCRKDIRHTISDVGVADKTLNEIYTPDQKCGSCSMQIWVKVHKDNINNIPSHS